MRHSAIVVLGIALLVGCGGDDHRASNPSPPRERTLLEGHASHGGHYKLALTRQREGTCWELVRAGGSGAACGLGLGGSDAFNVAWSGGPQAEFIYGPVTDRVSRIEVKRGNRIVASTRPRRAEGGALLFFFTEVPRRQKGRLVVAAYDKGGREIDRFTEHKPPGVDSGEPAPGG
jgi:hypothetical protein